MTSTECEWHQLMMVSSAIKVYRVAYVTLSSIFGYTQENLLVSLSMCVCVFAFFFPDVGSSNYIKYHSLEHKTSAANTGSHSLSALNRLDVQVSDWSATIVYQANQARIHQWLNSLLIINWTLKVMYCNVVGYTIRSDLITRKSFHSVLCCLLTIIVQYQYIENPFNSCYCLNYQIMFNFFHHFLMHN